MEPAIGADIPGIIRDAALVFAPCPLPDRATAGIDIPSGTARRLFEAAPPTAPVRAEAAVADLQRLGTFDGTLRLVVSPTGTGWTRPGRP